VGEGNGDSYVNQNFPWSSKAQTFDTPMPPAAPEDQQPVKTKLDNGKEEQIDPPKKAKS
jgi:hypothetical protein